MAPIDDVVDVHIVAVEFFATKRKSWYIYLGAAAPSHCLAIHDDLDEAVQHAIEMATYRVAAGNSVQIRVKQDDDSWKVVWRSAPSPMR